MSEQLVTILTWFGIVFCISQSAMFSGLNLAFFSVGRLRLEVLSQRGNSDAQKVLAMRQKSNFLLSTILWGNVAINVFLTLLSNSLLAGVGAFFFSTVVITFAGEITPQAYFSRHALRMAALLAPVLKIYQVILYPAARPTAFLLDLWLGEEGIHYFRERELHEIIRKHIDAEGDIGHVEGKGALNFLVLDDLNIVQEGEDLKPDSVLKMRFKKGRPVFPGFQRNLDDPFLQKVHRSGEKWVILSDETGNPRYVLDADGFLRDTLLEDRPKPPFDFCYIPIIVEDESTSLGDIIPRLRVHPEDPGDDVIDQDIILLWDDRKKIITGADILGRMMRGIVKREQV